MKTFAIYNRTGKIQKMISTTRRDIIEKNIPKDHGYIEVNSNVKTTSHQIVDGKVVGTGIKPQIFAKPKIPIIDQKQFITEKMIDDCKDIDSLKEILKKMIAPKIISFGKDS